MTIANLSKRLEKIEARRPKGRITKLVNLAGHPRGVVADAVTNWGQWVADGRANRTGDTLIIHAPKLTVEEWIAQTAKERGEPVR
ncbi:hypothetical protein J2X36_005301 [Methylobacterium sp. BE186]|uniref:hypothetical protein n=1 Tax=Methylobacterium sp. BE186 TaxID=2817715 RepID=UPI00286200EC|nr:hypothetical protein [Methylobacterium sp. BE186]MDR7040518.1 hypothetical protein [Methylobacterium sp. BE186]